ncbi:MAG TPA: glycoside hydrolase family 20 zincin-like fold domain-containing protein [Ardenticatenaceae bacterium]|nr:glycoside hydrolase family 20 zincin-like fold domain-containing protein [Ardenticatenaceae bacterium]
MSDSLLLMPRPRHLIPAGGLVPLDGGRFIALNSPDPQALRVAATRLQRTLRESAGVDWEIVAGTTVPAEQRGVTLSVIPGGSIHPQGYELTITAEGIYVVASTAAGAFYGAMTLCQIVEQCGASVPTLRITDWPDFLDRGVMLDISRDKIPTLESLFGLVDLLASWKINQLQLYTEHTFAYRNHPTVWADASPLTGDEILALDAYCRARCVELVPNQNSFGHMQRWLVLDRYRPLAEVPSGRYSTRWGFFDEPLSLCPIDPASLDFVRSLFDELLPHFSSHYFNVGCDETIELGMGRSQTAVAQRGEGRVYLDFLLQIYREVKARGRVMQFWGDIIMEHPELVPELPHDAIALEWGYEADHLFDHHGDLFAASGVPFYVCPGTSTWNSVAGRTENALGNLRSAALNGLTHGAVGYLNTDWGDNGHWQPLPASYLPYVYGAAVSWCYQANHDADAAAAASAYAFRDPSCTMGRLAYDLGNAHEQKAAPSHYEGELFLVLQMPPAQLIDIWQGGDGSGVPFEARTRVRSSPRRATELRGLDVEGLARTRAFVDEVIGRLPEARMQGADAALIAREYTWAANLLRHACDRGIWIRGLARGQDGKERRRALAEEAGALIAEFEQIWLARNRPGGLRESRARMEAMRGDYEA